MTEDGRPLDGRPLDGRRSTGGRRVSSGSQWQCHLATPGERLAYLRHSGHLSDLTITFPGHHDIIQVHRWVLAISSPVFEAMLYGPLAEGDLLHLPEDPPEAFNWLLDHIYLNHSQLPGVQLALQVYQLAAKYQMDPLCKLCSQYLVQEVTASTFPGVYETALMLEDDQLLAKCAQMVCVSSDAVLCCDSIPGMGRAAFSQLLHHPNLSPASEISLFHALTAWGRAQVLKQGKAGGLRSQHLLAASPTPGEHPATCLSHKVKQFLPQVKVGEGESPGNHCHGSEVQNTGYLESSNPPRTPQRGIDDSIVRVLRRVVDEFLPCVRFLTMTTDEYVQHVLPSAILTSEESVAILMNIRDIPNVPLPSFVTSLSKYKRKNKLNSASLLICQHHHTRNDQEILRDFKVPKTIHLTQVTAPGVTSLTETSVKIFSGSKTVTVGRWQGIGCKFDPAVELEVGVSYSVVVEGAYGPCVGCECRVLSDADDMHCSGKTLTLTPVFLEYW
ncbi:hypothetical protein OTU49_011089, partial [Cherax quadricarinatus]